MFFINTFFKKMFEENDEIFIVNCIYKINRYRILLFILFEITNINIFYYANFVFLKDENLKNYQWLIKTIKRFYKKIFNISLSDVWLSDNDERISSAINSRISSNIVHLLCMWHINNNVLKKCRKFFHSKEAWNVFYKKEKN